MAIYAQFKKGCVQFLSKAVITIMISMCVLVIWQVFSRYVLNDPSKYTEELATLLMIWIGIFGATLGFEKGSHLGVDIINQFVNDSSRRFFYYVTWGLIFCFSILIFCWGGFYMVFEAFERGNMLKTLPLISRAWVYLPVPICGVFICILAIEKCFLNEKSEVNNG